MMGLKLKVFIGYIVLIFLLGFIIYLFRGEHTKRNMLNRDLKELEMVQELSRNAYSLALDLFSQGEVVSIWNENDLEQYRKKREKTCDVLSKLRAFIHMPEQKVRIDSVCLLLEQKEMLLSAVMNTFGELGRISETVEEKLPAIVRQVRKQSLEAVSVVSAMEDTGEKKEVTEKRTGKNNFFKNIFGRKEKKSAYKRWREKKEAEEKNVSLPATMNCNNAATVKLLHSLNDEVSEKQESQQQRLFLQMDSMHAKSRMLNVRLNGLVVDFETMAGRRLEMRYKEIVAAREESYNTVAVLSLFILLLAIIIYICVHRDVNKRYRYRKELEHLNCKNRELLEARDRMMLAVSHDLRAPLTVIRGYAEEMSRECDMGKRSHYRDAILQSSESMLAMLNNLLLFYRLDMGKEQSSNILFRVGNIADTLEIAYRLQAESKRLHFTVECEDKDAVLFGDRERILQVGNNLLSNAIKFTQSGNISLCICYRDSIFYIEVSDTGTGIPEDRLTGIFRPFERLENADSQEGYGLGLAVTREIVELLSGKICVESILGKGTTFRVSLPLPVADEESVHKRQASPVLLPENLYVAVVDNDSILLAMTVGMFTRHKINCDGYHSARELLEAMREHAYDVLVTDIRMPGINGFELLELLRTSNVRRLNTIPVIAVTARVEKQGEEFLKAGFSGYLYKPFSVSELLHAVKSCIGEGREYSPLRVDFTSLLVAEKNKTEMLELFVSETRKDMNAMVEYDNKDDRDRLLTLVHHLFPVWENIRISTPLKELRSLLASSEKLTGDDLRSAIKNVICMGEHAIGQAEKIIEADRHE